MKVLPKILIFCLSFISIYCTGQNDSIRKQQLFISFDIGIPTYNKFLYKIDGDSKTLTATSKSKATYNLNFEHNIKHFTINCLYNYSQNEFNGQPFIINGKSLGTAPHSATVYKKLEVYQNIKYNYFQVGLGLGFNYWIKKHNICFTVNFHQSVSSNIILNVYYTKSPYNDQDTTTINLARNQKIGYSAFDNVSFSGSLKLMYTYKLKDRILLSFSTCIAAGYIDPSGNSISSYYGGTSLAYRLIYQESVSANLGLRYRLF